MRSFWMKAPRGQLLAFVFFIVCFLFYSELIQFYITDYFSSFFLSFFPAFFLSFWLLAIIQFLIYLKECTCSSFRQTSSFQKSPIHAFFGATLYATVWFWMQAVTNWFQRSQEWYQDYKKIHLIAGLLTATPPSHFEGLKMSKNYRLWGQCCALFYCLNFWGFCGTLVSILNPGLVVNTQNLPNLPNPSVFAGSRSGHQRWSTLAWKSFDKNCGFLS